MHKNQEKYIKSLPLIGMLISVILAILFFFFWKAEGPFWKIILYCLLPFFVNTAVYLSYVITKKW
ncbi:hypothetical protein [Staphylococcus intermedius]|uniref:Doubtful CDS n=1 Tax=Staphylococcus intermedius NCTC 11048 TaxID=1141106 RepID=A0A380G5V2_STAIN|nr:hypothetical protein [Staphylococcus intermedius]PCF64053.1 hypothetical protein B5C04_08745 [Staphylococcus intermedius]PCF78768.1 hypothetical protein B4W74_09095 [Staphylococcus intermedius]PCF79741.1 hypothetical protein B4W70_08735 [Staphylococcus intermedius]PCF85909.1 hypothetical protein B4W76_09200 [Staphylococcus intermedius]PCF89600.1 hypothetical protein B4W75_01810 [Staphylococcus intermedius]